MREVDFYPWVQRYLNVEFRDRICPKSQDSLPLAAITAQAGGQGSGKWSRPDLALVHLWRHKYAPSYSLDLYGFEVKTEQGCDLTGVHEALAHTRSVHYSYLTWHYPSENFKSPQFETIYENCEAYGVGLITFSSDDPRTYRIHSDAKRADPDAASLDDFIETRFSDQQKETLLDWLSNGQRGPK